MKLIKSNLSCWCLKGEIKKTTYFHVQVIGYKAKGENMKEVT